MTNRTGLALEQGVPGCHGGKGSYEWVHTMVSRSLSSGKDRALRASRSQDERAAGSGFSGQMLVQAQLQRQPIRLAAVGSGSGQSVCQDLSLIHIFHLRDVLKTLTFSSSNVPY